MILRNVQSIKPVSDLHLHLENATIQEQQKYLHGDTFIDFITKNDTIAQTLLTEGGCGLFRLGTQLTSFTQLTRFRQQHEPLLRPKHCHHIAIQRPPNQSNRSQAHCKRRRTLFFLH